MTSWTSQPTRSRHSRQRSVVRTPPFQHASTKSQEKIKPTSKEFRPFGHTNQMKAGGRAFTHGRTHAAGFRHWPRSEEIVMSTAQRRAGPRPPIGSRPQVRLFPISEGGVQEIGLMRDLRTIERDSHRFRDVFHHLDPCRRSPAAEHGIRRIGTTARHLAASPPRRLPNGMSRNPHPSKKAPMTGAAPCLAFSHSSTDLSRI